MILAGDIGGTKTSLAIFSGKDGGLGSIIAQKIYPSSKYSSLDSIVEEFAAEYAQAITKATFGVAGPVVDGEVKTLNLSWTVNARSLGQILNIDNVNLINDLEATAIGIEALAADQLETISTGPENSCGGRAIIAAGTGLGMATVYKDGSRYRPVASEGGHADFAPRNEMEIDLFRYLNAKFNGHVSCERVLSGPGLFNIYSFLREIKFAREPAWLTDQILSGDAVAAVSAAGLSAKCDLASKALDMFVEIYGAIAGNLALVSKATGGVYLGGGIAPKIRTRLIDGRFMQSFKAKGRISPLLAVIPVKIILNEKTALLGAGINAVETCQ